MMRCKIKPSPHALDQMIERGLTSIDIENIINKGNRKKRIVLGKGATKDFIEHSYFKMVCICRPCNRRIETVMIKG